MPEATYRGRFAPSPTGPLHFGSVVAAAGSYLQARTRNGQWLVRIDDVDTGRSVPGAAQAILSELERLGLTWDGEVVFQSKRTELYACALAALVSKRAVFACACSRKQLQNGLYPGTCRDGLAPGAQARTTRLRVDQTVLSLVDDIQGPYSQDLGTAVGDFVLLRADNIHAYHLATVVDDAEQKISHVVRGADLLDSTPRQIALQRHLELPTPGYAHLPVALHPNGRKLSKQTHANAVSELPAHHVVYAALKFLGHEPPAELARAGVDTLWQWALSHWELAAVPQKVSAT